jgi:hypothetical protein
MPNAQDAYNQLVSEVRKTWSGYVTEGEKAKIKELGTSKYALRAQSDLVDLIGSQRELVDLSGKKGEYRPIALVNVSVGGRPGKRPEFHATIQRGSFKLHYVWQALLQRSGLRVMVWAPSRDPENQKVYDKYLDSLDYHWSTSSSGHQGT